MEFLKLELKSGKVINTYSKGDPSKDFFFPFNYHHVYNMLCTLLDKTPTPQNRKVDTKYLPFHQNVMDVVMKGYVKINHVASNIKVTAIKGSYNADAVNDSVKQITWRDCQLTMKDNFSQFKEIILRDFGIDYDQRGYLIGFERTIDEIVTSGERIEIYNLLVWLKENKLTPVLNFIQNNKNFKNSNVEPFLYNNKISSFTAFEMNKKVFRGIIDSDIYEATFYLPITPELRKEYELYSKGWTTMLDGGTVRFSGFVDIHDEDVIGFLDIKVLSTLRKSELLRNKDDVDFEKVKTYTEISKKINSKEFKVVNKMLSDLKTLELDLKEKKKKAIKGSEESKEDPLEDESYKKLLENIKLNNVVSLNNIEELFKELNLSYTIKHLNDFFVGKEITVPTLNSLIRKIRKESFWSINRVKDIFDQLGLECLPEDLEFGKSEISEGIVTSKIENKISKLIK